MTAPTNSSAEQERTAVSLGPLSEETVEDIFELVDLFTDGDVFLLASSRPGNGWRKHRTEQRVRANLCVMCGVPKGDSPTHNCSKCREYLNDQDKLTKRRSRSRQPKKTKRPSFCRRCADHDAARQRANANGLEYKFTRCARCRKHRQKLQKLSDKRKATNA